MSRIIGFFSEKTTDTGTDLTTKGDMHGYSDTNTRIPIGNNDEVLTADSSEALGLNGLLLVVLRYHLKHFHKKVQKLQQAQAM